jgi:hypothetical protein
MYAFPPCRDVVSIPALGCGGCGGDDGDDGDDDDDLVAF